MHSGLAVYNAIERVLGRRALWRVGRWLYSGSRRELRNDPRVNGEYALLRWRAAALKCPPPAEPIVLCDVGANVGHWTTEAAARLAEYGHSDFVIHACEPAPAQRAALAERLAAETASGRVVVDARGVAAEAGMVTFSITGEGTGDSAISTTGAGAGGGQTIEVSTLDAIAAERGYGAFDLVKVDTEGNDFNVIKGAAGLFDAGRIGVLQFEYNWRWVAFRYWLKDVFDFVHDRPYRVGRLTQEGVEIYDSWHPELDRFIETNFVLVREDLIRRLPHWFSSFDASNLPVDRRGDGSSRPWRRQ